MALDRGDARAQVGQQGAPAVFAILPPAPVRNGDEEIAVPGRAGGPEPYSYATETHTRTRLWLRDPM